jgi:hypothetical protein
MTSFQDILSIAVPKVPLELQEEAKADESYAYTGTIDMIVALGLDADVFWETKTAVDEDTGETIEVKTGYCTVDLTLSQKWLAALFTYKVFLERLKMEKTIEAINFSTLTFSIKGLEKIPENINDSIYWLNRNIQTEIDKAKGANAILGTVVVYGGDSNE